MMSIDEITNFFQQGKENAKKRIEKNKHILFDFFDSKGILSVQASFEGSGDSGGVETVNILNTTDCSPFHKKDANVSSKDLKNILETILNGVETYEGTQFSKEGAYELISSSQVTVESLIHSICYDALKSEHEGWENNDGAYGDVQFESSNRSIFMNYYERSTELHEHEF